MTMSNYWQNTISAAGQSAKNDLNQRLNNIVEAEFTELFSELLPKDIDIEKLETMRQIVRDARLDNKDKAKQLKAIAEFNEVAVALLTKVFK